MTYDRTLFRPKGRTTALVAWLRAHPSAVCLVPNEARKKLLVEKHGVEADRVIVPPPDSFTVDHDYKPVLYQADGKALVRAAGFAPRKGRDPKR
jgi:hypothetical protein